ncbi:MAG: type II toxin-antitoxin system VapC family toxin [Gammaproteobacteria bacterium]|nr:type II toxin-antitoxin system VapC family toxin [Gammaproteobacteria bacterium]
MIVPDVNLLVHAHDAEFRRHTEARGWWEDLMNGNGSVGLSWVALLGFIRITTNRRIVRNPLAVEGACERVRSWIERPQSILIQPGDQHASIIFRLLAEAGSGGNLTTDAHLAALAIEHQAELHSTDADMARFPGLRWINPLG